MKCGANLIGRKPHPLLRRRQIAKLERASSAVRDSLSQCDDDSLIPLIHPARTPLLPCLGDIDPRRIELHDGKRLCPAHQLDRLLTGYSMIIDVETNFAFVITDVVRANVLGGKKGGANKEKHCREREIGEGIQHGYTVHYFP
jgi:hypothetical protein